MHCLKIAKIAQSHYVQAWVHQAAGCVHSARKPCGSRPYAVIAGSAAAAVSGHGNPVQGRHLVPDNSGSCSIPLAPFNRRAAVAAETSGSMTLIDSAMTTAPAHARVSRAGFTRAGRLRVGPGAGALPILDHATVEPHLQVAGARRPWRESGSRRCARPHRTAERHPARQRRRGCGARKGGRDAECRCDVASEAVTARACPRG